MKTNRPMDFSEPKLFGVTIVASVVVHAMAFNVFTFHFQFTSKFAGPELVFLGPVLKDRDFDFVKSPSGLSAALNAPPKANYEPSLTSKIRTPVANLEKPRPAAIDRKITMKTLFNPPPLKYNKKVEQQNDDLNRQRVEKLYKPLSIYPDDSN